MVFWDNVLPLRTLPRGRWLILLIGVLILSSIACLSRLQMERAFIAYRIYRAHIFTPPPRARGESSLHRVRSAAQFFWDFSAIPVARNNRLKLLNPTLRPLVKDLVRRQATGEGMQYSMHIYREIRWRLNFTPDVATTRARTNDLRNSLVEPGEQKLAAQQQPSDGSWGRGIGVWYLKLYYSVDEIQDCIPPPEHPLSFLDRINSPERLTAQLDSDLHDKFLQTGVFNREELDETFSALARLLFGRKPAACYAFHPQLGNALRRFVTRWQNPVTGCWGQWMVDREGRIWKMDDMAITFHVVSDLHGQVDHLDLIAKRVLQLDAVNFPAGIRFNGHYEDHLNWDVVKILRLAWPVLDSATRRQAQSEISRMLHWCLTQSYQPDGSFKLSDLDDTLGDAYEYGTYFLNEAGYFRRQDRFWTDQDFPEADAVRDHIESRLKSLGLNDSGMREAYKTLKSQQ
ncbi:MAG: hypothetical protein ACRD3Q_00600 [Terriglobales bacterium]